MINDTKRQIYDSSIDGIRLKNPLESIYYEPSSLDDATRYLFYSGFLVLYAMLTVFVYHIPNMAVPMVALVDIFLIASIYTFLNKISIYLEVKKYVIYRDNIAWEVNIAQKILDYMLIASILLRFINLTVFKK